MTARGNCVSCGFALDPTGFCWQCSGDGTPPKAEPQPPQHKPKPLECAPTNYPADIRQLIHRALHCATLSDKSLAVQICRELEKRIPGVGWASAASELEAIRVKKAERGPMAESVTKVLEGVPF